MPDIIKGNVIMLFIKQGNAYHAIGYGRNHSLKLEFSKDEVHSRQHDNWTSVRLITSQWMIECEYLYSESADYLIELAEEGTPITVMLGLADNYTTSGIEGTENEWSIEDGYRGKALITRADITARTGELATLTVELEGVSSLAKVNKDDPEDDSSHSEDNKIAPTLSFTTQSSVAQYSSGNEYTLSSFTQLNNPSNLPVRFIVEPFNGRLII